MYLIEKHHYDNAYDEYYTEVIGVVNGDDDEAMMCLMNIKKNDNSFKYTDSIGITYPYFTKRFIPELIL